ncbi:MAG: M24 family metallopeptidase [Culicoidibacterales bacterium]
MKNRIEAIQNYLTKHNYDAYYTENQYNRRYLSGFTGTTGAVLITKTDAYFITDFRYTQQAKAQCPVSTVIEHHSTLAQAVAELALSQGIKTIAVEIDHLSVAYYQMLEKTWPVQLMPCQRLVEDIRMIKQVDEIVLMKKAVEIIEQTYAFVLETVQPGMRECDLALEAETYMRRLGASGPSFDTIVASGWRGALPHGRASEKTIETGELVTIDFGAFYQGYASDMTRTFAVGTPASSQMVEIYELVLKAQVAGVEAVAPGKTCKSIDDVTRGIITAGGYGPEFGHTTGHGLGLEVHEAPRLSQIVELPLQPGMVVTVEPGIYVEGLGGVRIEDDILVTETGYENLMTTPKQLIIVGE